MLLAQNPYAARIFGKAYAFLTRPIWVEGYPRNDVLTTGDGAATREALGIRPDERVLLYAPTWRDDRAEMVDFVDPAALAAATDAVVLVRGHSRTLQPGRDAVGPRVIDVTGFPDTSQLLLVADALITDYSSVMFDFSVTGKPMYFLVPDIEHYRGELRGFYFDLVGARAGAGRAHAGRARRTRSPRAIPRRTPTSYRSGARSSTPATTAMPPSASCRGSSTRASSTSSPDPLPAEPVERRRPLRQRRVPVAEPRRVDGVVGAAQHADHEAPSPRQVHRRQHGRRPELVAPSAAAAGPERHARRRGRRTRSPADRRRMPRPPTTRTARRSPAARRRRCRARS